MSQPTASKGTAADWLGDRIMRGLIWGALRLPYDRRVPMMGAIMRRFLAPLTGYRKRAETNLRMVYPDMQTPEIRAIANACCDNFGRTLIENYSWQEFGERMRHVSPTGPGLAHLEQAEAQGRPVIFVTGHFGNYEAPRQLLTKRGHVIGALFRRMSNPYFNAHYETTLASWSGPVFAQGREGTMGFVRHLRRGGKAVLLFDVAANGATINFLGHPARTATSAADIALRVNALIIPYFGIRQPDRLSFAVELQEPIAHSDPVAMTKEMTARLERQINAHPAQWFWVHRRWKRARAEELS